MSRRPKISNGITVNRTCGGSQIVDLHERKKIDTLGWLFVASL
jgi:hypothetical protein